MAFGFLLFMSGYLFKIMRWVEMTKGIYSGPILLVIGIALLTYSIIKKPKN